jgi:hypothetical protein
MYDVAERIIWDDAAALHIKRASRPGGSPNDTDIEVAWTEEVIADPDRHVDEPYEGSEYDNVVRLIGYSTTAGFVITVIAIRQRSNRLLDGKTARRASRRERAIYAAGSQS